MTSVSHSVVTSSPMSLLGLFGISHQEPGEALLGYRVYSQMRVWFTEVLPQIWFPFVIYLAPWLFLRGTDTKNELQVAQLRIHSKRRTQRTPVTGGGGQIVSHLSRCKLNSAVGSERDEDPGEDRMNLSNEKGVRD